MSQELKIVQRDVTPATAGEIESHISGLGKQGWTILSANVLAMTWLDASQTNLNGFKVAFFLVRNVGETPYVASGSDEVKRGRGRPPKAVEPSVSLPPEH